MPLKNYFFSSRFFKFFFCTTTCSAVVVSSLSSLISLNHTPPNYFCATVSPTDCCPNRHSKVHSDLGHSLTHIAFNFNTSLLGLNRIPKWTHKLNSIIYPNWMACHIHTEPANASPKPGRIATVYSRSHELNGERSAKDDERKPRSCLGRSAVASTRGRVVVVNYTVGDAEGVFGIRTADTLSGCWVRSWLPLARVQNMGILLSNNGLKIDDDDDDYSR